MVDVGDVFAVPFDEGTFVLCRVLSAEKPLDAFDKHGRWRVATCEWMGPESGIPAALASGQSMSVLRRRIGPAIDRTFLGKSAAQVVDHWDVQSIGGAPPPSIRKVGFVAPSAEDRALRGYDHVGAWIWVAMQYRAEQEFRQNPAAVEARWEATKEQQRLTTQKAVADAKARKARMPTKLVPVPAHAPTLAKLSKRSPLTGWRRGKSAWIGATRAVLTALVHQLVLRPARTPSSALASLSRATRALNTIDRANDHPFDTTDAEALVEALVTVGIAAGLTEDAAALAVDEARDW